MAFSAGWVLVRTKEELQQMGCPEGPSTVVPSEIFPPDCNLCKFFSIRKHFESGLEKEADNET